MKTEQQLFYVYMPAISEKDYSQKSKPAIQKAWFKAMQKEFPVIVEQTYIRKGFKNEIVGLGNLLSGSKSVPVLVAAFKTAAQANRFIDILKNSDIQKRYTNISPRSYITLSH